MKIDSYKFGAFLLPGLMTLFLLVGCGGTTSAQDASDAGMDAQDGDAGSDLGDGSDGIEMEVISTDPIQGPLQGGTMVTISGRGFEQGSLVSFGANDATDVTFLSAYQLQAATPPSSAPGSVSVIVRATDGKTASLPDGFSYVDSQLLSIGWCVLQSPASTSTKISEATESIYGRAFVEGCTEGDSACSQLVAQLGFGAAGSDPTADSVDWTWSEAVYNAAHTDDNNDEFKSSLVLQDEGSYSYTYRFSVDDGQSWTYCDLDGTENGVQTDMMGQLTVTGQGKLVGWCNIQYPPSTSTVPSVPTEMIYGQVFVENCTEGQGMCQGLNGELGWGPKGEDPFGDPSVFTWIAAEHNPGNTSNNDEFQAYITPNLSGEFSYAFRFTADDGANWAYCDLDSTSNGLQVEQMGTLNVQTYDIAWCNLQYPASLTVSADSDTEAIWGRALIQGCTEGEKQCRGILAQVGFGEQGIDPSSAPESFTWADAVYNPAHTDDDNDEYSASIHPTSNGSMRYVVRFSGDGGSSWKYCDLDGTDNGFSQDQLGQLTVQ